ncbi:hypothetical protein [Sinomonas sp. RB5]
MQLIAILGDERIDASKPTRESWAEVKASAWRKDLTMPGCGLRAVATGRGEHTRFFAHYRRTGCNVDHGGESCSTWR